jgi:hypothetical protein
MEYWSWLAAGSPAPPPLSEDTMRKEYEAIQKAVDDSHVLELIKSYTDHLLRSASAGGEEERSQEVVGGEGNVQMGHIEHVFGDIVDKLSTRTLPQEGQKRILQEKETQCSYWQPVQTHRA